MNKRLIITQFKRECWENKSNFFIQPMLATLVLIIVIICAGLFSGGMINSNVHFSYSSSTFTQSGASSNNQNTTSVFNSDQQINHSKDNKKFNIVSSVQRTPESFSEMVQSAMHVNCIFLFLVFSMVIISYLLRCLFDDRKNKNILFWHSMPVSETTNVLVKLSVALLVAPIIMLALNFMLAVVLIIVGFIFFGYLGVGLSFLLSSILGGSIFYFAFQVFFEFIFILLMLLPVIGFSLLVSARAKNSPFLMFVSPLFLILADILLERAMGVNIGVVDLCSRYLNVLRYMRSIFQPQNIATFDASMIIALFVCVAIGGAFISVAIWLRNNRNEI